MKRKTSSAARRVAAYEARMRRRGMVKTHVWVPAKGAAAVASLAKDLREGKRPAAQGDALARAIQALKELRPLAESLGIRHAAVFGSVARGEAHRSSDLDVLVEFGHLRQRGLFAYMTALHELGEALGATVARRVDVVGKENLRASARQRGRVRVLADDSPICDSEY